MGKRSLIRVGVLAVAALGSVGYGMAAARYHLFPYGVARDLARALYGRGAPAPDDAVAAPPRDRRPGLWHRVRSGAAEGADIDRAALERLGDLPYMDGYEPPPDGAGVTVHEPAAQEGLNLVVSGHAPEAALLDMQGRVLHAWRRELADVWPELAAEQDLGGFETFWRRAHVLPDGGLLAIFDGIGLVRLDRDSRVAWAGQGNTHHDLFVDDAGRIHTLERHELARHDGLELTGPVQEDFIVVFTPEGVEERRLSILDAFLESDYASLLKRAGKEGDILHTNTIELMDGRFADRHPMFAAGNVLISVRDLDTIAVVDMETERVVWALTGVWVRQHQPTVLDDGNLLVFDNMGAGGGSRVLELDPFSHEILWSYAGTPDRPLSSWFLGSCQRLANGNTLVTESTMGRAVEVDREGAVVWEYLNPHRAGDDDQLVASLFEVVRIDRGYFTADFLAFLGEPDAEGG